MAEVDRYYLRVREVAERLSMDDSTVYKMLKRGLLPSIRLGKSVRIPAGALTTYLRRLERDGRPPVEIAQIDHSSFGSLDDRFTSFRERVGIGPDEFIDQWKNGAIEDTADTAAIAIEALGLRHAFDRTPIPA